MKLSKVLEFMAGNYMQVTYSVVVLTIGGIALFGFIGYYLDQYFNTKPALLFTFIVLSMPPTQYVLYKRIKQLTKGL